MQPLLYQYHLDLPLKKEKLKQTEGVSSLLGVDIAKGYLTE